MRSRLGATTQPAGWPLSSAVASSVSKLACGARVSVTMIPSSLWAPARARIVPSNGGPYRVHRMNVKLVWRVAQWFALRSSTSRLNNSPGPIDGPIVGDKIELGVARI